MGYRFVKITDERCKNRDIKERFLQLQIDQNVTNARMQVL